jgi:hypothetical protein
MRASVVLAAILLAGGVTSTGTLTRDDFPEVPTRTPHTLERACTTPLGFCRIANLTPPGQPCSCVTPDGARVGGYAIAWRWTDVPAVVK